MLFRMPGGRASGKKKARQGPAIPIRGVSAICRSHFSPEGGAVPGDRIVGILTPGEGMTIYPVQSPR